MPVLVVLMQDAGLVPVLTCPPCSSPQAGQTPLETARYHNNPEVALLLTKAPQVGLAMFPTM